MNVRINKQLLLILLINVALIPILYILAIFTIFLNGLANDSARHGMGIGIIVSVFSLVNIGINLGLLHKYNKINALPVMVCVAEVLLSYSVISWVYF